MYVQKRIRQKIKSTQNAPLLFCFHEVVHTHQSLSVSFQQNFYLSNQALTLVSVRQRTLLRLPRHHWTDVLGGRRNATVHHDVDL